MSRKMEGALPKIEFFGQVMINEYADLTMGFERRLRERFSSSAEQYEADICAYTKAAKILGPGYVVHIQDRYHKGQFDAHFGVGEPRSELALASDRHFHERPYLEHHSYIFITRTCGTERPPISARGAFFRGRLAPRQALEHSDVKKFEEDCRLFVRIVEENSDIRCCPLTQKEFTGLIEQYVLLQPPDAPPQTMDINMDKGHCVGNKHTVVATLADAEQLPAECSAFTRMDRYSTEKSVFPTGTGAWFGALIDAEHICNLYLVIAEPSATLKQLETRRRRLRSLAAVDRENLVAEKDITAYLEEAATGEHQMVRLHVNVIAWTGDKAELSSIQNKLVVAFGKAGITPHLETIDASSIVLAGIPGNAGSLPANASFLTFAMDGKKLYFAVVHPSNAMALLTSSIKVLMKLSDIDYEIQHH